MKYKLPRNTILQGDALEGLRQLPSASVDCIVTSPPYFNLRDYGNDDQIGQERTVDAWVESLRAVFHECARVMKLSGALWLNVADTYSKRPANGAPHKSMLLGPERLLIALQRDGWIVRNKVVWAKTRTTPHPTTDRLTSAYEIVYFLVRSVRYHFDLNSIRDPYLPKTYEKAVELFPELADLAPNELVGRNPGDVWSVSPSVYSGAHFATFPPELVRRPILATCPLRICALCGTPWRLSAQDYHVPIRRTAAARPDKLAMNYPTSTALYRLRNFESQCSCKGLSVPGVVLDPFFGSGTVGDVARGLGRDWLGIELNPNYIVLAKRRLSTT